MYKFLLLPIMLCCFLPVKAQNIPGEGEGSDSTESLSPSSFGKEVLGDTSVYFRSQLIREDSINTWKNKKQYIWIKSLDSLLRDAQNESQGNLQVKNSGSSFMDKLLNSFLLRALLWLIAAGFAGVIIYQLFLSKGIFGKATSKIIKEADEEEEEDSMGKDFNRLLRNAYAKGDLRTAMRFLFLKTLQKLHECDLISFTPDKTNSMYANELPVAKRNEFATLALYYEYIRYGNAAINKETFDVIEIKFNDFINRI